MDFSSIIAIVLGSVIGSELYLWIKDRISYPYKWKCPICNLTISTSDKAMIEVVKSTHTHKE